MADRSVVETELLKKLLVLRGIARARRSGVELKLTSRGPIDVHRVRTIEPEATDDELRALAHETTEFVFPGVTP